MADPAADGAAPDPGTVVRDPDAGARGALYALLARAFRAPDGALHAALADGRFAAEVDRLLAATDLPVEAGELRTEDDHDLLSARYHDLFALGFGRYEDRTDGSLSSTGPPVPLHGSAYRTDVAWSDVNLDLARAYEHFGVGVRADDREHHDHLRLVCEFAGLLARREATVDPVAARARLDLLDRHLRITVEGVAARIREEPGTGVYAELVSLLDRVSAADRADLADRLGEAA